MSLFTHPARDEGRETSRGDLRPIAETVCELGGQYRFVTGSVYEVTAIEDAQVQVRRVACPCAGLTIEAMTVCLGHSSEGHQVSQWSWAKWRAYCASGTIRQFSEPRRTKGEQAHEDAT